MKLLLVGFASGVVSPSCSSICDCTNLNYRTEMVNVGSFCFSQLALYDLPSGKLSKVMEDLHLLESSILSIRVGFPFHFTPNFCQ